MLIWLAVAAGIGAVVVSVRWWLRQYDGLGRPRPFPKISVSLLAVLTVGAAIPPYLHHREENRLSQVASQLVGTKVEVHCQTVGQEMFDAGAELGFVRYGADGVPEHRTEIKHGPCQALNSYLRSDKHHPSDDEVVAVHVLTHESMHMRGLTSEAEAECAAVQRDELTAELLGADPADARALARRYWLSDYPQMPDEYRSTECKPGGRLDEGLATAPWASPSP